MSKDAVVRLAHLPIDLQFLDGGEARYRICIGHDAPPAETVDRTVRQEMETVLVKIAL